MPSASNVIITPSTFKLGDTITGSYTYINGTESGSLIRWYKNGDSAGSEFDDLKIITPKVTKKGDTWFFTITPSNGTTFGTTVKSADATVLNTAPTVPTKVTIHPQFPVEKIDNLFAVPEGSTDNDNDKLIYKFQWYKNGASQSGKTSSKIDQSLVVVGDTWKVDVKAFDGTDDSPILTSSSVTVLSTSSIRNKLIDTLSDYYVKSATDTNWYKVLASIGDLLSIFDDENTKTKADFNLDLIRDIRISDVFGSIFPLNKLDSWTFDDYQFALKILLDAFSRLNSTNLGVESVGRVLTEMAPTILEHNQYNPFKLGETTLNKSVKVASGGSNWMQQTLDASSTPINGIFYSIWFSNSGTRFYISGTADNGGIILSSTDFGKTLNLKVITASPTFKLLGISGGNYNLWAVGEGGRIYYKDLRSSVDWALQSSNTSLDLNDIDVFRDDVAFIVANSGSVLMLKETQNDWKIYTTTNTGTSNNLNALKVINPVLVWIVGNSGTVLKWNGISFSTVLVPNATTPTTKRLRDVDAFGSNIWIVGETSAIFKSTDSGATWSEVTINISGSPVVADFVSISMQSQNVLVILSSIGNIYKSTDNGTNWVLETRQTLTDPIVSGRIFLDLDGLGMMVANKNTLFRNNSKSPTFTAPSLKNFAQNDVTFKTIVETRRSQKTAIDIIFWNNSTTIDKTLKNLIKKIAPAHAKIFFFDDTTFANDLYSGTDKFKLGNETTGTIADSNPSTPVVINSRLYRTSTNLIRKTKDGLDEEIIV